MLKDTPSMAKNKMRRCLKAVLDPHPSKADIGRLWNHFGASCAYCGLALELSDREGHIDHVVASSTGGTNDIQNHVLSCARCNGDEKREESWETFLVRKAGAAYEDRRACIQRWLAQVQQTRRSLNSESRAEADAIISQALQNFDITVEKLRELRHGGT